MDVTAAVITYLKADARVAAKVSTRIDRVVNAPFPQFPSVVVQKVDDLRGDHTSTGRYSTARIQCSSFAKTDSEADEVSELIADALDATVNTVIGGLYIVSCFDAGVVPDNDPKVPLYVYHRDFRIMYSVRI